jgi:putative chitinase
LDHTKLFDTVRHSVLGGSLSTSQIGGIEALLAACADAAATDVRQVAYVLATPMVETGGSYIPITESLNYSDLALTSKFSRRITPEEAARWGRTSTHEADQQQIADIIYGGV